MIEVLHIKSKSKRKRMKLEFERLLPENVFQEKEFQMRSNNYMPILKKLKDEKRYSQVLSTMEADESQLCPLNQSIDNKYKVPPPLKMCPVHKSEVVIQSTNQFNRASYL
ncbi:hypothetical protein RF11_16463 [Thelohanellus kitauei]|uniref:Uncharacterized protein n=1 Tax=Thelohanellus kitauei TaxID=669202 RepID=A0A0C2IRW5_THEKT|nr:hypothetical protein RF11_16463 [Thelohanellus kitauei]